MNRRELLQRALLLVGASVLPVGDPVHADSKAEKWEIGQAQLALIAAVAGTIIPKTDTPGAVEAGVPQHFVELLRTWASPTRRVELIQAFERIDDIAQRQRGRHFTDLTPGEQYELLAAHDIAALPADPAYAKLKELVVVLFYLSETALTHELAYEHTPGEWKPSVPVTPETRAVGGIGSL